MRSPLNIVTVLMIAALGVAALTVQADQGPSVTAPVVTLN